MGEWQGFSSNFLLSPTCVVLGVPKVLGPKHREEYALLIRENLSTDWEMVIGPS